MIGPVPTGIDGGFVTVPARARGCTGLSAPADTARHWGATGRAATAGAWGRAGVITEATGPAVSIAAATATAETQRQALTHVRAQIACDLKSLGPRVTVCPGTYVVSYRCYAKLRSHL